MPYLALVIFLAALVLFWLSARQRKSAGLPGGRIIYTDTRAWGPVEKPLYSSALGITGKPDYLVDLAGSGGLKLPGSRGGQIIPVEVKSSRIPPSPYDAHIYQLAIYCLLVEHTFGKRPAYGILHYAERSSSTGRTFAIDFTPALETAVLNLLAEIRAQEGRKGVNRSHDQPQRCTRCGFREVCDQRLG